MQLNIKKSGLLGNKNFGDLDINLTNWKKRWEKSTMLWLHFSFYFYVDLFPFCFVWVQDVSLLLEYATNGEYSQFRFFDLLCPSWEFMNFLEMALIFPLVASEKLRRWVPHKTKYMRRPRGVCWHKNKEKMSISTA